MKLASLAILSAFALTACADPGIKHEQTDNERLQVTLLVTIKECEVYRFYDSGRYHYLTLCPNSQVSTWQRVGKNNKYDDTIPTVTHE